MVDVASSLTAAHLEAHSRKCGGYAPRAAAFCREDSAHESCLRQARLLPQGRASLDATAPWCLPKARPVVVDMGRAVSATPSEEDILFQAVPLKTSSPFNRSLERALSVKAGPADSSRKLFQDMARQLQLLQTA